MFYILRSNNKKNYNKQACIYTKRKGKDKHSENHSRFIDLVNKDQLLKKTSQWSHHLSQPRLRWDDEKA